MDKIKAMDVSEAIPAMRAFAQQVTLAFLELDSKRLTSGQRTKANWSDFMADLLQELTGAVESGDIEMVAKIAVVCASLFLQRIVDEDSLEKRGPEVHAWAVKEIRRDQVEPATARRTEVKKEKWNEIRADAKIIQERNPDWDTRAVANQLDANYRGQGRARGYSKSTIERALGLRDA